MKYLSMNIPNSLKVAYSKSFSAILLVTNTAKKRTSIA